MTVFVVSERSNKELKGRIQEKQERMLRENRMQTRSSSKAFIYKTKKSGRNKKEVKSCISSQEETNRMMNFQNHTLIYIFVCKHAWNLKDKALFSIEWDACCPMFWLKKRAQKGKEETKRHGIISMQQPYWTTSPTHKSISSPSWLLYCHRLCKISLQCWAFMRRVSYNWI